MCQIRKALRFAIVFTVFASINGVESLFASPNTQLLLAIDRDDLAAATSALDQGADANYADRNGEGPLWFALARGRYKCIDLLLARGADPKALDPQGDSLLVVASGAKNPQLIRTLVEKGADVNHVGSQSGVSPLSEAIWHGNNDSILLMLNAGADVKRVVGGRVPLAYAAGKGNVDVIKWLFDRGAEIESTSEVVVTPLEAACQGGHVAAVNLLIERGATVKVKPADGVNLLELAALFGHLEVAKRLHELGLRTENRLHVAAGLGNLSVLQKELIKGANLNQAMAISGLTPLMFATSGGQPKVVQFLLEHGADPNARNKDGQSPLHMLPTAEIAQLLLKGKADVNTKDLQGATPLDFAGDESLRQVLIRNGARSDFE
jgi:uncharacterized protein